MSSFHVPYSAVNWFKAALNNHTEVVSVEVADHHFVRIVRKKEPQEVNVVLVDIYTVGLADVLKARQEFPDATCIVTNGDWNAYTPEAKGIRIGKRIRRVQHKGISGSASVGRNPQVSQAWRQWRAGLCDETCLTGPRFTCSVRR